MISPPLCSDQYAEIANNFPQTWLLFEASGALLGWSPQIAAIFPEFSEKLSRDCSVDWVLEQSARFELATPDQKNKAIQRRLTNFQQGISYQETHYYKSGRVLEVKLQCLADHTRLLSFFDSSDYRNNQDGLNIANQALETKVSQRTNALMLAHEEAVYQAKVKGRFLAAISHDLLQPINAARLFTASLQSRLSHPADIDVTENISQSLSAAEELISDLLDVSRLEAGKLATQIRPFVLSEVLKPLANEFQALAEEKGMDFRVQFSDLIGVSDPKLLRRALQNFLGNAFRYNPNGKVLLGVRRQGSSIRIEVWDNGDGIAEAKQTQIFNEFTRLESDVVEGGLGLGLAIAKGICRVLDHDLGLRSSPKQGSVFSIVLPRGIAKGVCSLSEVGASSPYTLKGIKLLCVADQALWVESVQQWAKQWGAEVKVISHRVPWSEILTDFPANTVLWDGIGDEKWWIEQRQKCNVVCADSVAFGVVDFEGDKMKLKTVTHWSSPLKPLKLRLWLMQQKRASLVSASE